MIEDGDEGAARRHQAESDQVVVDMLAARKKAYATIFANPETADAAMVVLEDLARFSRAHSAGAQSVPADAPYDTHRHALVEGRREVFYRIVEQAELDVLTLFRLYHRRT